MSTALRLDRRHLLLAVVVVVCLSVSVGYFVLARGAAASPAPAAGPAGVVTVDTTGDARAILAGPHLVFRHLAPGPGLGAVAVVALADPAGPRAVLGVTCERVYAVARAGVCLSAVRGLAPTYAISTLGQDLMVTGTGSLVGIPSRARLSADGSLVATTTFVAGHDYATAAFSTQTVIRRAGGRPTDLETWRTVLPDRTRLTAADRNFWGVTFAADDDTFYATAASQQTTWLVRGSIRHQTMTALRTDAECPSLSPDGQHVAYKKRLGEARRGVWRLAVLDLRTATETLLAETRSVDDQVAWIDDTRVAYAMARGPADAGTADVWSVPADGSGAPGVLIPLASSPAAVPA